MCKTLFLRSKCNHQAQEEKIVCTNRANIQWTGNPREWDEFYCRQRTNNYIAHKSSLCSNCMFVTADSNRPMEWDFTRKPIIFREPGGIGQSAVEPAGPGPGGFNPFGFARGGPEAGITEIVVLDQIDSESISDEDMVDAEPLTDDIPLVEDISDCTSGDSVLIPDTDISDAEASREILGEDTTFNFGPAGSNSDEIDAESFMENWHRALHVLAAHHSKPKSPELAGPSSGLRGGPASTNQGQVLGNHQDHSPPPLRPPLPLSAFSKVRKTAKRPPRQHIPIHKKFYLRLNSPDLYSPEDTRTYSPRVNPSALPRDHSGESDVEEITLDPPQRAMSSYAGSDSIFTPPEQMTSNDVPLYLGEPVMSVGLGSYDHHIEQNIDDLVYDPRTVSLDL